MRFEPAKPVVVCSLANEFEILLTPLPLGQRLLELPVVKIRDTSPVTREVTGSNPVAGFGWCSSVVERLMCLDRLFPGSCLIRGRNNGPY